MARKSSKKERRAEEARGRSSRKRHKWMLWLALLVALAAAGGWYYQRQSNLPGQQFESMGRTHIPQGTPAPGYNSSPPTSGAHATPARWGRHTTEILEINQVHNLEHGGVLIQYNCSRLPEGRSCSDLRSKLQGILAKAQAENGHKIILAPYGKQPRPVAVTAWTWLQYFDDADEAGILAFAEAHYNNAPEDVP